MRSGNPVIISHLHAQEGLREEQVFCKQQDPAPLFIFSRPSLWGNSRRTRWQSVVLGYIIMPCIIQICHCVRGPASTSQCIRTLTVQPWSQIFQF